uniref:Uncharacterized protein n=1 Tax=Arundo donax TaxID=35708 RepID=A0A0A9GWQ5_ARUDO
MLFLLLHQLLSPWLIFDDFVMGRAGGGSLLKESSSSSVPCSVTAMLAPS